MLQKCTAFQDVQEHSSNSDLKKFNIFEEQGENDSKANNPEFSAKLDQLLKECRKPKQPVDEAQTPALPDFVMNVINDYSKQIRLEP